MEQIHYTIHFPHTKHSPIELPSHSPLSVHLTIQNSPVLFGCRTGICGTCIVTIQGDIPPPQPDEKELLEILAPDHPKARLACQIDLTSNIEISAI